MPTRPAATLNVTHCADKKPLKMLASLKLLRNYLCIKQDIHLKIKWALSCIFVPKGVTVKGKRVGSCGGLLLIEGGS